MLFVQIAIVYELLHGGKMKISSKQSWFQKFVGAKAITKRQRIISLFEDNLGRPFNSSNLHATFGSSFRSRVSEINRDPFVLITIKNRTLITNESFYWAEVRRIPLAQAGI
jgi:hypothetical protein